MEIKKEFILELDEVPKLLFISQKGMGRGDELYVDGEKIRGTTFIKIESEYEGPTRHQVGFLTAASGKENK